MSMSTTPLTKFPLPAKHIGAGVLIRCPSGRVLLVEPTYKPGWEIPGGVVEHGESPSEAAARECLEELGRPIVVGRLLCVHYADTRRHPTDGIMFVFDGGWLDPDEVPRLALQSDELRSARFVDLADLDGLVNPFMAARLRASAEAGQDGTIRYMER